MRNDNCISYFDDRDLEALQAALKDIWITLQAHDPERDWAADEELKTRIAEKLMALAAIGVTKPEELRRRGLEILPVGWGSGRRRR
jgi:hypothetical protein